MDRNKEIDSTATVSIYLSQWENKVDSFDDSTDTTPFFQQTNALLSELSDIPERANDVKNIHKVLRVALHKIYSSRDPMYREAMADLERQRDEPKPKDAVCGEHWTLPETKADALAMDVNDLEPMTAFFCYCGEELYAHGVGVAVFPESGGYECRRCGQKYKTGNGITAELVIPSPSEWAATVERLWL